MNKTCSRFRARTPLCSARGLALAASALFAFSGVTSPGARAASLSRGFTYQRDVVPEKPWSIHIIKADRAHAELVLRTTLGGGDRFGLGTLSDQVKSLPPDLGTPVAAINGDYYRDEEPYIGDPKGLQIMRGELVSGPSDWTCLWVDGARQVHMTNVTPRFRITWPSGESTPFKLNEAPSANAAVLYSAAAGHTTALRGGRELVLERVGTNTWLPLRVGQVYDARIREIREAQGAPIPPEALVITLGRDLTSHLRSVQVGNVLHLSVLTFPDLSEAIEGIGGGPPLVRAGKVIQRREPRVRHPRTAIGWNKEHLFLFQVDGRQRNLSVGMTGAELAEYLVKIGCEEALSLDGGGSATCWVGGQVMNSPSEGRERPMANAVVLVREPVQPSAE